MAPVKWKLYWCKITWCSSTSPPAPVQLRWIIYNTLCVTAAVRGADPRTTRDVRAVLGARHRRYADGQIATANNDRIQSPLLRGFAVLHIDIILGSLAVDSAVVCLLFSGPCADIELSPTCSDLNLLPDLSIWQKAKKNYALKELWTFFKNTLTLYTLSAFIILSYCVRQLQ